MLYVEYSSLQPLTVSLYLIPQDFIFKNFEVSLLPRLYIYSPCENSVRPTSPPPIQNFQTISILKIAKLQRENSKNYYFVCKPTCSFFNSLKSKSSALIQNISTQHGHPTVITKGNSTLGNYFRVPVQHSLSYKSQLIDDIPT